MNHKESEQQVAQTIKALRIVRGEKQAVLANALQIAESDYSKLENGRKHFKITELHVILEVLKISYYQLYTLVEIGTALRTRNYSYSELIAIFSQSQKQESNHLLNSSDLEEFLKQFQKL